MNILKKLEKWWWFTFRNPVIRKGEAGGFKWIFRRLDMEIRTVSGNFVGRWTAAEHPYAYLVSGNGDDNIIGFAQMLYYLGMVITTDQGLVDDIQKAFKKYEKRLEKKNPVVEDETEEKIALEEVKAVQDVVDMPKKERKKYERSVDGGFKKVAQNLKEKNKKNNL